MLVGLALLMVALGIYFFRLSGRKLEKIVSLKGNRLPLGGAGTWCGLAADDFSPELVRRSPKEPKPEAF